MNMTRDRVQSIVWAVVIAVALALLLGLTFRVNAVKSQVRLTERRIIAIKQEKLSLETEFQTRANQQQLAAINAVEFGFKAPGAGQYVEGERQLAALSRPVTPVFTPGAQGPVRMALADRPASTPATGSLPAALAPLAHQALASGPGTRLLSDRNEARVPAENRVPHDVVPGKVTPGKVTPGKVRPGKVKPADARLGSIVAGKVQLARAEPAKRQLARPSSSKPPLAKVSSDKSQPGSRAPARDGKLISARMAMAGGATRAVAKVAER